MGIGTQRSEWRLLALRVVLVIFLLGGFPLAAERPLRVAFTDWFPYTYLDGETPAGFEIETVQNVFHDLGYPLEFTCYPWKRCLVAMKTGDADLIVSLLKTPKREDFVLFPREHISLSRTVFFTLSGRRIRYTGNLGDLRGMTIGVIAGFSYGEAFDEAVFLRKDEAKNPEILLTKLLRGRHDLGAENQAVIKGYAQKLGIVDRIRFLEPPIHHQRLYVGFASGKQWERLADTFSRRLSVFKQSEIYREILAKYGISPRDMAELP